MPQVGLGLLRSAHARPTIPLEQYLRFDGVRGLYALRASPRGAPLVTVPFTSAVTPYHRPGQWALAPAVDQRAASIAKRTSRQVAVSVGVSGATPFALELTAFELRVAIAFASAKFHLTHGIPCPHAAPLHRVVRNIPEFEPVDDLGCLDDQNDADVIMGVHQCMEAVTHNTIDTIAAAPERHLLFPALEGPKGQRFVDDEVWGHEVLESLTWALHCVRNRTLFAPCGAGVLPFVAPIIDCCNHAPNPNCAVSFEEHTVVLRSLRPIAVGEELLLRYHDPPPLRGADERLRWFLHYGFMQGFGPE